jgi:methyl-accepting chemotaxis protein
MKRKMTVGQSIGIGFTVVIAITVVLGGMGVWSMQGVKTDSVKLATEYVPEVQIATDLRGAANRVMYAMRGYAFTEEEKFYTDAQEELAAVDRHLNEAEQLAAEAIYLQKLQGQVEVARAAAGTYQGLVEQTVTATGAIAANRQKLDQSAAEFMDNITQLRTRQNERMRDELAGKIDLAQAAANTPTEVATDDGAIAGDAARDGATVTGVAAKHLERLRKITLINEIIGLTADTRVACFKSQAVRDPALIENANENFTAMAEKFEALKKITYLAEDLAQIETIQSAAGHYQTAMNALLENWLVLQDLGQQRNDAGRDLIAACKTTTEAGLSHTADIADHAATALSRASLTMMVGFSAGTVLAIFCAIVIARRITGPLRKIITGLNEGADQVNDAAGQVAGASQSLAEGASEQASSLEETSSALEQMAAMSRTNAENGAQANTLSVQARDAAHGGDQTMARLQDAMTAINDSAGQISKIIKVIEEIAFQTNLLALNAAVEAARAGEHGKGFAVVADEVRNLAQRAAEAARETTGLIENSVTKAKEGTDVAREVGEALGAIVGDVGRVTELINGIANASQEQAQGVEQINSAVAQMDRVTQQNASNAEESASAAEQLNAQAATVKSVVGELASLVSGAAKSASQPAPTDPPMRTTASPGAPPASDMDDFEF